MAMSHSFKKLLQPMIGKFAILKCHFQTVTGHKVQCQDTKENNRFVYNTAQHNITQHNATQHATIVATRQNITQHTTHTAQHITQHTTHTAQHSHNPKGHACRSSHVMVTGQQFHMHENATNFKANFKANKYLGSCNGNAAQNTAQHRAHNNAQNKTEHNTAQNQTQNTTQHSTGHNTNAQHKKINFGHDVTAALWFLPMRNCMPMQMSLQLRATQQYLCYFFARELRRKARSKLCQMCAAFKR